MNWKKINTNSMHNFEEEQELVGKYIKMEPANPAARQSSIITLENEAGEEVSFRGCTIIDNCFENIAQGEVVRIVYKGKRTSKKGAEYKDFDVFKEDKGEDLPPVEAYQTN